MNLLPLGKLGARCTPEGRADFGVFLPWVSDSDGVGLGVKLIHENDQFLQDVPAKTFEMECSIDPNYGEYWHGQVEIDASEKPHKKSAWGKPGRYVYRYFLERRNNEPIDWIIDPYAREFGIGKLSAFTLGYEPHIWSDEEELWKTPRQEDLIVYELMINEFGGDMRTATRHLEYLQDLGVNCIEIMPVTNISNTTDWGFLPIGYFGVDERFGKRRDMQRLIDSAHQKGIAVILDMVYGHTDSLFPYSYLYREMGFGENPFLGSFAKDLFGESTDFNRALTRDFFYTVNHHWLSTYHVDGFRYDCVPNYWDGPTGLGYANLVYQTYKLVFGMRGSQDHWQRFFEGDEIHLIQCAEQLEEPVEVLDKTYSSSTWQNQTFDAAIAVARAEASELAGRLTYLGHRLGLVGYPAKEKINEDTIQKSALQYIENHDHYRFVCNFCTISRDDNDLLKEGDRRYWYKVQPYLIAIMTARGIPLIWQGQELCENYFLPESGIGRVVMFRPMRWDYFYDPIGKRTIWLTRRLMKLRRKAQFLRGEHWFYDDPERYQSRGLLLFSRRAGDAFSLVALNFTDSDQKAYFSVPLGGDYYEEIHGEDSFRAGAGEWLEICIPSNYGRIWTVEGGE
ncbi:MAG: alpha-amylase [Methanosarcinales archaeon]|nr:alpha-amylase [Methanosarcinales archaeon]